MARATRMGDTGGSHQRTERFFQREGYWYYSTREGVDIGPFDARDDAEDGCMEFIDFVCNDSADDFSKTLALYRYA
ncbi:DUF6316 family protein [Candidatus Pelagadaptatus aseana]|uniref:DUF6316 family protein n=1 Tax=Candidatus Pelagadaptatus aseana TaxID=3120508 RepID=UPI003C6EE7AD